MHDEDELDRLELEDQAETVGKMTPREYARLRGMHAQLIYHYIRNKKVEMEICQCGRKVVDVATLDAFFQAIADKKRKNV